LNPKAFFSLFVVGISQGWLVLRGTREGKAVFENIVLYCPAL
jgi:hypothetical protein